MSAEPNLTNTDYELLSAYIDEMLEEDERRMLEARLQTEPLLRRELAALRQTVTLLNHLPTLQAPRNFTLTAAMVGELIQPQRATQPRKRVMVFPVMSALSAAAALVMMVIGIGLLLSTASPPAESTMSQAQEPLVEVLSNVTVDDSLSTGVAAVPTNQAQQSMFAATGTAAADLSVQRTMMTAEPLSLQETEEQSLFSMEAAEAPAVPPAAALTLPGQQTTDMLNTMPADTAVMVPGANNEVPAEGLGVMQYAPQPAGTVVTGYLGTPFKPYPSPNPAAGGLGAGGVGGGISPTGTPAAPTFSPMPTATLQPTPAAVAQSGEAADETDAEGRVQEDVPQDGQMRDRTVTVDADEVNRERISRDTLGVILTAGGGILLVVTGVIFWLYRRRIV